MTDCIFTLDYEIYGSGHGSLRNLVLDPTRRLAEVFQEFGAHFVVFAEALEFTKMEEAQSDPDIAGVREQLRELHQTGHEIALHLHPWWANAQYEDGTWLLDWNERKIGTLEPERIKDIVTGGIRYLRDALGDRNFTPLSFRAGQWAIQPSRVIASVLVKHGIRLDSSVFKGGCIHDLGLDYRPASKNDTRWRFGTDVNVPDPQGQLWEIPIHTEFVPFWKMIRPKRLKLHSKTRIASQNTPLVHHWRDFARFRYPRKLDFCRMSFEEMQSAMKDVLNRKRAEKDDVVVAIGHSKDFVDSEAVRRFLAFLRQRSVQITTFSRLLSQVDRFPN